MAITYIELVDFDKLFQTVQNPIILNNVPYLTEEDRLAFNALIITTYESDVLSHLPSCVCGQSLYGYKTDTLCPKCNTPIEYPAERKIDLRIWLRAPEGIRGFISPYIWAQLTRVLSPKGYNLMEWLTSKRPLPRGINKTTFKAIKYLESINWKRGLNEFIDNFDAFIDLLPLVPDKKLKSINAINNFKKYCRDNRDKLFPTMLPLPNKVMIILEKTQRGSYADKKSITGAIDAARTIADISSYRHKPLTHTQLENKVVSIIMNLVDYHLNTLKNTVSSKKGIIRKQLVCSRAHLCMRCVITSISAPHYYGEIWVPWAQAVEMLKMHLESKLIRMGFCINYAQLVVEASGNIYSELINTLLKILITEGKHIDRISTIYGVNPPENGLAVLFQRNPSLNRSSSQNLFITKVKTDLSDKTISFSTMCTTGPNNV